jgi:hypothetical protein
MPEVFSKTHLSKQFSIDILTKLQKNKLTAFMGYRGMGACMAG